MIRLFILVVQFALMIGRVLERRGLLKEAITRVEADLGKLTGKMLVRAVTARNAVTDAPDRVRSDARNRDNT